MCAKFVPHSLADELILPR